MNSKIIGIIILIVAIGVSSAYFLTKNESVDIITSSNESIYQNEKIGLVINTINQPKGIVAGDFYWSENIDNTIYFAVADCTGHGVPGAMVSVICSNALTKALIEDKINQPSAILDRARELVIGRLGKSKEDIRDGMDISLCAYNKKLVLFIGLVPTIHYGSLEMGVLILMKS